MLSRWHLERLVVLGPSVLFFLWNPRFVLKQPSNVPKRTIAILGLLTLLAIGYFAFEWNDGVRYQGTHHTIAVCIINLLW